MRINLGSTVRECIGIACGEGMAMGARALGLGPVAENIARTAGYKGGSEGEQQGHGSGKSEDQSEEDYSYGY